MTALKEFERLEATGLWRPTSQDQRREVIVSLGDATLTMSDTNGTALAHWSLGAVIRANSGQMPAIFHPDGDPDETLEMDESEREMVDGIDRLLRAIDRKRPKPGKLRLVISVLTVSAMAAAAVFWLPDALKSYTVTVVPGVKRAEIGTAMLGHIARVTGAPCTMPDSDKPLENLTKRMLPDGGRVVVLPDGARASAHLPGQIVLLNRAVLEDHEDADVAAGYILAEKILADQTDPLDGLVHHAGLWASLRLLTTGQMPDTALRAYAEHLMVQAPDLPPSDALLAGFDKAEIRSTPFAFALDITGESTVALIEGDPRAGQPSRAVLSDGDWIRLQAICGG